jgi:hypothetical protein
MKGSEVDEVDEVDVGGMACVEETKREKTKI